MEDMVRDLLAKLETATDDARTALVTHGLPGLLDSLSPGKQPELPEKAQAALAEEFVSRGPGVQLQGAHSTLAALKEEVRSRALPHACSAYVRAARRGVSGGACRRARTCASAARSWMRRSRRTL
jgi:hypothetical protein